MRLLNLLPGTARVFIAAAVLITGTPCRGQNTGKLTAPSSTERTDDSLLALQKQMIELKSMLEEMRTEVVRISSRDRKSTRLNSSHTVISYAVFCLKKKKRRNTRRDILQYAELTPEQERH